MCAAIITETGYNYGMEETHYNARRKALLERMEDGAAILGSAPQKVRSNDTEYPYRQDSDFYYLTGFEEDNAALVLVRRADETKTVLFVQPKDETLELWTGTRLGVEEAKRRFDVDAVYAVGDFDTKLPELIANLPTLYLDLFDDASWASRARAAAKALCHQRETRRPVTRMVDVHRLVRQLRLLKSDEEVALIKKALAVTRQAHHRAMRLCRPQMMEYGLQAEYEYVFKKEGAYSDAYTTIVAGGDHANTLHYVKNDAPLRDGELVLVDAGCEYGFYASDITRTFPVNGRFTPAQREVYEAVLDVQERIIENVAPGVLRSELQRLAERWLCEKLVELGVLQGEIDALIEAKAHKKYFPHGIGHWMGIDVHDPVPYYDEAGNEIALKPGMVMTVEPGLYLRADDETVPIAYRGIGIRIEDDILVTEDGCENLSAGIVKSVADVEAMCRRVEDV